MRIILYLTIALTLTLYAGSMVLAQEQLALASDNSNIAADTYPHISALENAILGQSFPGQPLTVRLERMEKKAFGSVSTSADLSERTDNLDDYTDKHLHKKLLQADVNAETPDYADNDSNQNQADYPHVTSLEQTILGQTFAGQPLPDRLSRMEVKAFGSASNNSDLSARTDALEAYAEKKLHKQPLSRDDSDTTTPNPQRGGLLSKVGQTLFSMAGGGGPGLMGGMGNFGGMGNGGGMGMGGGGMGMGGMGRGFGGGNMQRRQAAQARPPEPPAPPRAEDPAVYQATPPDPSAKLLVKVGWCEMKVFGHTFPDMHLTKRLGQLNQELHLEPGKSDVQLMDDIGLMIKTVQARR